MGNYDWRNGNPLDFHNLRYLVVRNHIFKGVGVGVGVGVGGVAAAGWSFWCWVVWMVWC